VTDTPPERSDRVTQASFWQLHKASTSRNNWVHHPGRRVWATVGALRPSGLRAWSVYDSGTDGNVIPSRRRTTAADDRTVAEGFGSGDDAFTEAQAAFEAYVAVRAEGEASVASPPEPTHP
jgi:hypothetical protein